MENIWIIYAFIYGIFRGIRECMKKASMKKSSLIETLFLYMLVSFVFTLCDIKTALVTQPVYIFWTFVKSLLVRAGFILSFVAIKKMPIGLYSVMTLSQMVFTTAIGVLFLKEPFGIFNLIGLSLVILGLFMVNFRKGGTDNVKLKYTYALVVLVYCMLNAVSAAMDKVLMQYMSSAQLQFWFMFFSTAIYGVIVIAKKEKVSLKTLKTNYWIPAMGILLLIGDRFLFEANGHPNSRVTLITLIIQVSVIITIIIGRIAFKEKNVLYKILCSCVIISGIAISLIQ